VQWWGWGTGGIGAGGVGRKKTMPFFPFFIVEIFYFIINNGLTCGTYLVYPDLTSSPCHVEAASGSQLQETGLR
jgi:hypothetical protein